MKGWISFLVCIGTLVAVGLLVAGPHEEPACVDGVCERMARELATPRDRVFVVQPRRVDATPAPVPLPRANVQPRQAPPRLAPLPRSNPRQEYRYQRRFGGRVFGRFR